MVSLFRWGLSWRSWNYLYVLLKLGIKMKANSSKYSTQKKKNSNISHPIVWQGVLLYCYIVEYKGNIIYYTVTMEEEGNGEPCCESWTKLFLLLRIEMKLLQVIHWVKKHVKTCWIWTSQLAILEMQKKLFMCNHCISASLLRRLDVIPPITKWDCQEKILVSSIVIDIGIVKQMQLEPI